MVNTYEHPLNGQVIELSNGRLAYAVARATDQFILKAYEILHDQYGFANWEIVAFSFDEFLTECTRKDLKLHLEWDIWLGFCLYSDSTQGDAFVVEFGKYLDTRLPDLDENGDARTIRE